ncbi:MAG: hypothetical protein HGA75_09060 [Thiobacillus sp.]|nr:hypothetical protein [Thiobacillus sp.]
MPSLRGIVGLSCQAVLRTALLAWLFALSIAATAGERSRPASYIGDIVWGGGQFVAVGAQGVIMTSPDGWYWTLQRPAGAQWGRTRRGAGEADLIGIAWGNGLYLAIDSEGALLASTDGKTWQARAIPELQSRGQSIHWAKGLFIVLGPGGRLFTSRDGYDWQRETTGVADDLVDLASLDNGSLVVIGWHGTVLRSPDGHRWSSSAQLSVGQLDSVATNGRQLVAVGNLAYGTVIAQSADGNRWTSREFQGFEHLYNVVAWHNDLFVMAGSDIAVSIRAATWMFLNARPEHVARPDWQCLASNGQVLVAIGRGGEIAGSYDGLNWFGGLVYLGSRNPDVYVVDGSPVDSRPFVESDTVVREWLHQSVAYPTWQVGLYAALIALYLILQVYVPVRTAGFWRIAAILPGLVLLGPHLLQLGLNLFFSRQILWPLWPFQPAAVKLPLACLFLVLVQVLWERQRSLPAGRSGPIADWAGARMARLGLSGWLVLGLAAGLFTGPVSMPPTALLIFAIGSTLLLSDQLKRPVAWFGATVVGGTVGMLAGSTVGIPLLFMGVPNITFAIQFLVIATAQYITLTNPERAVLRHWITINGAAAAAASILLTVIPLALHYKGHDIFHLVRHQWGYSERLASAAVEASWGVPFCLLVCTALGLYLQAARAKVRQADTGE